MRSGRKTIKSTTGSFDLATDAALAEVSDWQNRALEPMYPLVFLDALQAKSAMLPLIDCCAINCRAVERRQVKNKAVYIALGVTPKGEREVLAEHHEQSAQPGRCCPIWCPFHGQG